MMKISELCAVSGVNKSTVHNYLRLGLLPPPLKTGVNLHYYGDEHLEILKKIVVLRKTQSLSLARIKEILTQSKGSTDTCDMDDDDIISKEGHYNNPISDKGQQIIDKAIYLFSEYGYENVKIDDITSSLQMGKGTFYLYFKNKQELLLECFKTLSYQILPLEDKEQIRHEKDFFIRMHNRWVGFSKVYANLAGILNLLRASTLSSDSEIREKAKNSYDSIIRPLREDVKDAVSQGVVRDVDPELFGYILFGIAEQMAFRTNLDDRYATKDNAKIIFDLVTRIMSPEKAVSLSADAIGEKYALTDSQGVETTLQNIRINGQEKLCTKVGDADVEIDLSKVGSLTIDNAGSQCDVRITMTNGKEVAMQFDGNDLLSAESSWGLFKIPMKLIRSVILRG